MSINETALFSFALSYQPSIKRQIIMLPLHGQGTAAVDNNTGQGVPVIFDATGNVFVKQSE